jgi:hypothetical protein
VVLVNETPTDLPIEVLVPWRHLRGGDRLTVSIRPIHSVGRLSDWHHWASAFACCELGALGAQRRSRLLRQCGCLRLVDVLVGRFLGHAQSLSDQIGAAGALPTGIYQVPQLVDQRPYLPSLGFSLRRIAAPARLTA